MGPYILALFIFAAPQVLAGDEGDIMSCVELFKPEHMQNECCQTMAMKEEFESCKPKDLKDWNCDHAKCFLDKILGGILSGETIDDKKAEEALKKAAEEKPESKAMFDRVRSHCLQGKYEEYPPKEACPLMKFQICSYINGIVECPSWKQNDTCKKMSESAKTCKSVLENQQ